jgi:hypothetical protein
MMQEDFDLIHTAQQNFITMLDGLSLDQINKVPQGYNNNLIWNFAHVIASLQGLCYVRQGLKAPLDENFINKYKGGTKPEGSVDAEQYATIKVYALEGINKLRADYKAGVFASFKPFTTMSGFNISSADYAIKYVAFHHGIHTGYAMAIKKLVI